VDFQHKGRTQIVAEDDSLLGYRVLAAGSWREYVDLRKRKKKRAGEDSTIRSFILLSKIFRVSKSRKVRWVQR
jgi:hypothetical protein